VLEAVSIILLHKVLYDYVTLFDVYECAINPNKLEIKIAAGEQLFGTADYVLLDDALYPAHGELARFPWQRVEATNWMKAPASEELKRVLPCSKNISRQTGKSSD
jgi:hypothetical protein